MTKIIGDESAETLNGAAGDDVIKGRGGNDVLRGMGGADSIQGDGGNDYIDGGAGGDTLLGGSGDDRILGVGAGDDFVDGGSGIDMVDYQEEGIDFVVIDLALTTAQNTGGAGTDTLLNIENLNGTFGDDILLGSASANLIIAEIGDDYIDGRGGDDVLNPSQGFGPGDDTILGGDGDDLIYTGGETDILDGGLGHDAATFFGPPSPEPRGFTCSLAITSLQTVAPGSQVLLSSIEELRGGQGDDTFTGSTGDDVLRGDSGADELHGGSGSDTLEGAGGQDFLDGGSDFDWADFSRAGSKATITLSKTTAQFTGESLDTFASIEGVIGSRHGDGLLGSASANHFLGEDGADNLLGSGGADTLEGGAGKDTLFGGSGADTLIGNGGVDSFYFPKTADTTRFSPDLIWDLGAADVVSLHTIDANTIVAGNQNFVVVENHGTAAGQMTISYDAGTDRTSISLYTNADALADGVILIRGNHVDHDNFLL